MVLHGDTGPDSSNCTALRSLWADGTWKSVRVRPDGTIVESHSDGSRTAIQPDGTRAHTNSFGQTSSSVQLGDDEDGGSVTTCEDGSEYLDYGDGRRTWRDASGFTFEVTIDQSSGDRITSASDGSRRVERPDGSFEHQYSDGSVDTGTIDEGGNLVIRSADGTTAVAYADGSESWTDPWGLNSQTVVAEDDGRYTAFSDGWTESESADGQTMIRTSPTGATETRTTLADGTVQVDYPGGGAARFDPTTGEGSYTEANGSVFLLRRLDDGTIVGTDSRGRVIEHNPMTGATRMAGADGTSQTTTRLEDGSFRAVLVDGTEIVTAPNGSQVVTGPDGSSAKTTVTGDGWVARREDGTTVTSSTAGDGTTRVAYDYMAGVGGISSIARSPGDGTMQVVLGSGDTMGISVAEDGSITVAGPDFERTFDPGSGIVGRVQTALSDDGSTTVFTES